MKASVDDVKRAVFLVYANMVTYAIMVVGALTLFTLVFSWPIPLLGVGIFSVLLLSHSLAYAMLKAPAREVHLSRLFFAIGATYAVFIAISAAIFILAGS